MASVVHEPNDAQNGAQPRHGSGAEFRSTTQGPVSQPASSAQCVPIECTDAADVCNAKQSDVHFNVEFRAEAP